MAGECRPLAGIRQSLRSHCRRRARRRTSVAANTYISALNFGGTPLEGLNLTRAGFSRLEISDAILEEFAGVLRDITELNHHPGDSVLHDPRCRHFLGEDVVVRPGTFRN
jgi:hypothetical protein